MFLEIMLDHVLFCARSFLKSETALREQIEIGFFLMKQRTLRLSERQKIFYFATPENKYYRNRITN